MGAMSRYVQPDRRAVLLLLTLLTAACGEVQDGLNDVGKVRATFYRHQMEATGSPVEMPGQRLLPPARCASAAEAGLFDPCRPDGRPVELDAWGMPKVPRGPWPAGSAGAGRAGAIPLPPPLPARKAAALPARKPA
ncbi:hypothetical protein STAQ_24750 [Allostella sp. ATCC 35155]|nr:hypothetical protein STAQ_24750 [Stella sp. ATCC 35155]